MATAVSAVSADRRREFLRKLLVEKDYVNVFFQDFSQNRLDDLVALGKVFKETDAFLDLFEQIDRCNAEAPSDQEKKITNQDVFLQMDRCAMSAAAPPGEGARLALMAIVLMFRTFLEALMYRGDFADAMRFRAEIRKWYYAFVDSIATEPVSVKETAINGILFLLILQFTSTLVPELTRRYARSGLAGRFDQLAEGFIEDADLFVSALINKTNNSHLTTLSVPTIHYLACCLVLARGLDAMLVYADSEGEMDLTLENVPYTPHLRQRIHDALRRLFQHVMSTHEPIRLTEFVAVFGPLLDIPEFLADEVDFEPLSVFMKLVRDEVTQGKLGEDLPLLEAVCNVHSRVVGFMCAHRAEIESRSLPEETQGGVVGYLQALVMHVLRQTPSASSMKLPSLRQQNGLWRQLMDKTIALISRLGFASPTLFLEVLEANSFEVIEALQEQMMELRPSALRRGVKDPAVSIALSSNLEILCAFARGLAEFFYQQRFSLGAPFEGRARERIDRFLFQCSRISLELYAMLRMGINFGQTSVVHSHAIFARTHSSALDSLDAACLHALHPDRGVFDSSDDDESKRVARLHANVINMFIAEQAVSPNSQLDTALWSLVAISRYSSQEQTRGIVKGLCDVAYLAVQVIRGLEEEAANKRLEGIRKVKKYSVFAEALSILMSIGNDAKEEETTSLSISDTTFVSPIDRVSRSPALAVVLRLSSALREIDWRFYNRDVDSALHNCFVVLGNFLANEPDYSPMTQGVVTEVIRLIDELLINAHGSPLEDFPNGVCGLFYAFSHLTRCQYVSVEEVTPRFFRVFEMFPFIDAYIEDQMVGLTHEWNRTALLDVGVAQANLFANVRRLASASDPLADSMVHLLAAWVDRLMRCAQGHIEPTAFADGVLTVLMVTKTLPVLYCELYDTKDGDRLMDFIYRSYPWFKEWIVKRGIEPDAVKLIHDFRAEYLTWKGAQFFSLEDYAASIERRE